VAGAGESRNSGMWIDSRVSVVNNGVILIKYSINHFISRLNNKSNEQTETSYFRLKMA